MISFRYRLKYDSPEELKRVLTEQCEKINLLCLADEQDLHTRIHDIRKSFKRIRAVLKFIRKKVNEDDYKWLNREFRNAAKAYSDIRDHEVFVKTWQKLMTPSSLQKDRKLMENIAGYLIRIRDASTQQSIHEGQLFSDTMHTLQSIEPPVISLDIQENNLVNWLPGLQEMYGEGKSWLEQVRQDPEDKLNEHEWRKKVVNLKYQTYMLYEIWPYQFRMAGNVLDRLSESLGSAHDLFQLESFIYGEEQLSSQVKDSFVMRRIISRRKQLIKQGINLAEHFYLEEPEIFHKRMAGYLKLKS
ncbi:MAG TPA: CHAD domain-containing protein [Bacteroidales bacterium]|nr:CHAD domain-containing protein [Bacteroidales bacterium]